MEPNEITLTTAEELAAKYMRYWKVRCVASLISGTAAVVGAVLSFRQMRHDKQMLTAAALIRSVGERRDDA